jgi:hypothetical protein
LGKSPSQRLDSPTLKILTALRRGLDKIVLVVGSLMISVIEVGVGGLIRRPEVTPEKLARLVKRAAVGEAEFVRASRCRGEPDLVVVHDISTKVLNRQPLKGEHVLIQRDYGPGLDAGYITTVDVGTNTTKVS